MTTLSLLGGTWEYQFEDETNDAAAVVGTRMIKYVSGDVITTRQLYSAIAGATDEFQAMGFKNPMLPVTPNQYTMENWAFISRKSTEFLKEGTIVADWTLSGTGDAAGRGVLRVPYTQSVAFISSDIGKLVTQGDTGDTGTLLDFEIEPDGTTVLWVRPTDSTPVSGDLFDGTGTIATTNGTGAASATTVATNGQCTFTAIQAIGSVPTATEVYVVQDRIKLKDADTNTFQFWSTDPSVSLGIISVLIRTQNAGETIADADLEVFARRYGSLYDNFRLNVGAGGFSALPLASAPDINNTTGYWTTGALTGVGGTWTVGNGVYVGSTWATATAKGIITDTNSNTELEYYLVGDLTNISSTTAIKEYDFVTMADGDGTATTGTAAANNGGPTDTDAGEGGTVTITIGNTSRDHDNSTVAEPYSIIVNCQGDVPIAKVYERIKYVTRRGQDNSFWNSVSCSIPGEQWRGLERTVYYDGATGTVVEGEDVQVVSSGLTARLIANHTSTSPEGVDQIYVTLADIQTSIKSLSDNNIIADSTSTDSVVVDTSVGSGGSIVSHASVKSSPFGSFTGSQIFGAPGIDFRNPHSNDTQAYILTDDLGTLRTPPNTVSFTVGNTRANDRILVARDTGTSGVIDKDQFGGMTVTSEGATSIVVAGTVDVEVPPAGYIRVVETTKQQEHKYFYSSRTTGASGAFTLTAISDGTADNVNGTTSTTYLSDDGATFITEGVQPGMLINTDDTEYYEVVSVDGEEELTIRQVFGSAGTFATGATYTINKTIQAYTTADNIYDLIIDAEEDTGTDGSPGSITNTFVKTKSANFAVVVQVRKGLDILPFEQNQNCGDGNTTVTTVRSADTIAQ